MNQGKISVRYAKAFFAFAKESGQLPVLFQDMEKVNRLCHESDDFMGLLKNPVVPASRKKSIIREILKDHLSEATLDFLMVITGNNRENDIPGICRYFLGLVQADQGIVTAVVTSARELKGETLELIRLLLEKETGKTIELTGKINPALLGGMILRIGDRQYDGSISAQLKKMKAHLMVK